MADAPRAPSPPVRPLVVFDGDCGFCRYWVERWRRRTGAGVEFQPFQNPEVVRRFPFLTPERCSRAVQLIETDGTVSEGADAVVHVLARGGRAWPLRAYRRLPGAAPVAELAYRIVAGNRPLASRLTGLFHRAGDRPACHR